LKQGFGLSPSPLFFNGPSCGCPLSSVFSFFNPGFQFYTLVFFGLRRSPLSSSRQFFPLFFPFFFCHLPDFFFSPPFNQAAGLFDPSFSLPISTCGSPTLCPGLQATILFPGQQGRDLLFFFPPFSLIFFLFRVKATHVPPRIFPVPPPFFFFFFS